jgi:DNA-binding NarL/FixJ family response regulator
MTLRVFLVEDLPHMRELLEDLVGAIGGLRVVANAGTEAEAKLWLEDNPGAWDLAVIDLVLEQGSGMDVIARAKATTPHKKVVVFSSYVTPGMRAHCLKIGAEAVFDKADTAGFIRWLHGIAGEGPAPSPDP